MKHSRTPQQGDPETDILAYLHDHPDFFVRHPQVLPSLTIPHASGAATSLLERQLVMLREENLKLEGRLRDLVNVAGENDRLSEQIQDFAIALLQTPTLATTLARVKEALQENFDAQETVLRLGIERMRELLA